MDSLEVMTGTSDSGRFLSSHPPADPTIVCFRRENVSLAWRSPNMTP
jgi:hypothetical protein